MSINVALLHFGPDWLRRQLRNIEAQLQVRWTLMLNVDGGMEERLRGTDMALCLNPVTVNKRGCHGSMLEGMVSNIRHALQRGPDFDFVLFLSARTFFRLPVTLSDIHARLAGQDLPDCPFSFWSSSSASWQCQSGEQSKQEWRWWKTLKDTALGQSSQFLVGSPHEGLLFPIQAWEHIGKINRSIFHVNSTCVEEFAIQTTCRNNGIPFAQLCAHVDCTEFQFHEHSASPFLRLPLFWLSKLCMRHDARAAFASRFRGPSAVLGAG